MLDTVTRPQLIEPGVRYFLSGTLKECRRLKDKYINVAFNVSMCLLFAAVIGGFLWCKYKGKLSPQEKARRKQEEQRYLFTKMQVLAKIKRKANQNQNTITDLPPF